MFLSLVQIATTRRLTVHFNPPSSCVLEISVRGVKIGVKADDAQEAKVTSFKPQPALCPTCFSPPRVPTFSLFAPPACFPCKLTVLFLLSLL